MEFTLTPELQQFIANEVADGAFQTPSELVQTILDYYRERKLAFLRREIQVGIDEIERGESIELTDDFFTELKAEIARELEEERASGNGQADHQPASTSRLESGGQKAGAPEPVGLGSSDR